MDRTDVLIVGGGVAGAACARALSHRNLSVRVVDADAAPGGATAAAAGMLAPLIETGHDTDLLAVSVRGRDLYRELVPVLEEETGIDVGLWMEGILQLAFTEEDQARFKGAIAWQRQLGLKSVWLSDEELQERSPGVSREAIGAKLALEDGALEPTALLRALLASAEGRGARVTQNVAIEEIVVENGAAVGARSATERYEADAVVIAAGAWSGGIRGLPRPLSVEPIRGQMAAAPWPAGEPPAIVYGGSGYVLHRGNEAIVGSTMEHAGFDPSVTPEGLESIGQTMKRIYPALANVGFTRTWAGLRPASPDGRPIIGPDPEIRGLWYATGHGRNGILLAGVTGELIADLLMGVEVEFDLESVDPGRYWQR